MDRAHRPPDLGILAEGSRRDLAPVSARRPTPGAPCMTAHSGLLPSMPRRWQWCRKRSRIAVAVAASERNWFSAKSRSVVIATERCSSAGGDDAAMTRNRSSAATWSSAVKPGSSIPMEPWGCPIIVEAVHGTTDPQAVLRQQKAPDRPGVQPGERMLTGLAREHGVDHTTTPPTRLQDLHTVVGKVAKNHRPPAPVPARAEMPAPTKEV